jgi:hypothetical protein
VTSAGTTVRYDPEASPQSTMVPDPSVDIAFASGCGTSGNFGRGRVALLSRWHAESISRGLRVIVDSDSGNEHVRLCAAASTPLATESRRSVSDR